MKYCLSHITIHRHVSVAFATFIRAPYKITQSYTKALQNVYLKRVSVLVNVSVYCSAFVGLLCFVSIVGCVAVRHITLVSGLLLSLHPDVSISE